MHINADPKRIVIKAGIKDGSLIEPVASEKRESYFRYDGPNKPAGVWRLENVIQGLTVENRFNEKEVESCCLTTDEKENMALMEIRSAEQEVPQNGEITVNHTWEIK